jgi:hypothetical protein
MTTGYKYSTGVLVEQGDLLVIQPSPYNKSMAKKINLKIAWLVLIVLLLSGCAETPTLSPTPAVSFVTPTPAPVRPTPTFTAVVVPTIPSQPTSTATTSAQDRLLKVFQERERQNFSYDFEQTAELKVMDSVTRVQVKGDGEVAQGNIRQSLEISQSGQSQKVEQFYLDKQFYQKFENLKLWRKVTNLPKFASALPVSTFQQALEVKSLGQEQINNQALDKFSFKISGRVFFNSPSGIGLDNMGVLNAAEVWSVFMKGTVQDPLITVWLDGQGNLVRHSSLVTLTERTSTLTINNSYVITKLNGGNAVLNVPSDFPKN